MTAITTPPCKKNIVRTADHDSCTHTPIEIGITSHEVQKKFIELPITKTQKRHRWSAREVEFIRKNYNKPTKQLSVELHLPVGVIDAKIKSLRKQGLIHAQKRHRNQIVNLKDRVNYLEGQIQALYKGMNSADIAILVKNKLDTYHAAYDTIKGMPHDYRTLKEVYKLLTDEEYRYRSK